MPIFPGGFGATVTDPAALDRDDTFVGSIDGVMKPVAPNVARGYHDASHYADLAAGSVLASGATTTGWTVVSAWGGAAITTDGTSVRAYVGWWNNAAAFYFDFGSAINVGNYSHIAMDVSITVDSGNNPLDASITPVIKATVATGTALGGTTVDAVDLVRQIPVQATFSTVYVPLTNLTTIRTVGIKCIGTPFQTSRGWINIKNVRFAAATGLDQALHAAGTLGTVVIPSTYTTALTQRSWIDKPAGVNTWDQRPGKFHITGLGGKVYADDFFIDYTGAQEAAPDLLWLYNNVLGVSTTSTADVTPTIFELHANGHYKMGTATYVASVQAFLNISQRRGIVTHGNNAIFFQSVILEANIVGLQTCYDMEWHDVHVRGYKYMDLTAAALVTYAGTPVTSGTDILLDALDDTVRYANIGTTPMIFARDRFGKVRMEIVAKDTAQVANDLTLNMVHPTLGTTIETKSWTLTASFATYTHEYVPDDIEVALFPLIEKSTATANTITIQSVRFYGQQGFNFAYEFNSAWFISGTKGIKFYRCSGEGVGGDGWQGSSATRETYLQDCLSMCVGRQGLSFNNSISTTLENYTIIGSGRSCIDLEPYSSGWKVQNFTARNGRMIWGQANGFYAANWGALYGLVIDGLYCHEQSGVAASIGGRSGYVTNVVNYSEWRTRSATYRDVQVYGENMVAGHFVAPYGVGTAIVGTSSSDLESPPVTIVSTPVQWPKDTSVTSLAYAATLTVSARVRGTIMMTLTGNLAIAAPTPANDFSPGQEVTIITTQDATGGRVHTWNAVFKGPNAGLPTAAVTTANKINQWTFVLNATATAWIQVAANVGMG